MLMYPNYSSLNIPLNRLVQIEVEWPLIGISVKGQSLRYQMNLIGFTLSVKWATLKLLSRTSLSFDGRARHILNAIDEFDFP